MIELQRHIEVLLLKNECVIVPDFGGFMAHSVPARYDGDDHLFLPPLRTLGFNPQLRINDSLLAQSYVEAYDISYPEAVRRIDAEVSELKQALSEDGEYCLDDLGTLTVNDEGNYSFTPCEAGILSPELYGLGSVSIDPLCEQQAHGTSAMSAGHAPAQKQAKAPTLLELTDNSDDDEKVVIIKMSWIRNAVATAAAILVLILFAAPVANGDLGRHTMSQIHHSVLKRLMPQDTNAAVLPATPAPTAPATTKAPAAPAAIETPAPTATEATTTAETPTATEAATTAEAPTATEAATAKVATDTFYIVLASQVKRSYAETYVAQLHEQGYKDARIVAFGNNVRVTCGEYTSEEEAYRQVHRMHKKEEFAEAWVLKKKAKAS